MALTIEQINALQPRQSVWHYNIDWGIVSESKIRSITRANPVNPDRVANIEVFMENREVWNLGDFWRPGTFLTKDECDRYAGMNPSRIELAEQRDQKLREQGIPIPGEDDDEEVGEDPD